MKIKKNGKVIILTENDIHKISKRYLNEQSNSLPDCMDVLKKSMKEKAMVKDEKGVNVNLLDSNLSGEIDVEKIVLYRRKQNMIIVSKDGKEFCKIDVC